MKDTEYYKILEFVDVGGGLMAHNSKAIDRMEQSGRGDILTFRELSNRDMAFHKGYFSLLSYIWKQLPKKFRDNIKEEKFYKYVKHIKGEYEVICTFEDGSKMIEYDSIAMGKMNQPEFEDYIREQLPYIYTEIIGKYFEGVIYNGIIDNIEEEYKKFLSKL
jgi:hypothetical protein